jgi:pimeloyl-ACP methyl ester carboxylesterase
MRATTRTGLKLALRRGQPEPLPAHRIDEMVRAAKDRGTQRAVLRLYRSTPADRMGALRDALRPLDRPALVVWGVHDPYIDVGQAERQRETFPARAGRAVRALGPLADVRRVRAARRDGHAVPRRAARRRRTGAATA